MQVWKQRAIKIAQFEQSGLVIDEAELPRPAFGICGTGNAERGQDRGDKPSVLLEELRMHAFAGDLAHAHPRGLRLGQKPCESAENIEVGVRERHDCRPIVSEHG